MGARGDWSPGKIAVAVVAMLVMIWWKGGGGMFASMPTIANAGMNQIVVGSDPKNQTRYDLRSPADFGGAVVDYSFGSHGFVDDMGGRAMFAFANSDSFAAASRRAKACGTCLNSQLGNSIMAMMLIPRDEEALKQMKSVRLHAGSHFQISGQHLALQSMTHNGQAAQVGFGNAGIFLVSSIRNAD
jgi:hypothetical protein